MPTGDESGLPIGEVLKRTRSRQKVDIPTLERETKIRAKYLRALENEEWDVLPAPAYAKAFLRTYARFLGLDADALVDEYRRTVETSLGAEHAYSFPEPVLERRRRPGEEPQSPWRGRVPLIAALGAAVVVVLVALAVTGGSPEEGKHHHNKGKRGADHGKGGAGQAGGSASRPVTVALVTKDDMEICLVTGHGEALIDSQTLIAGVKEGPFQPPADNYRLDLDSGGAASLILDGKPHPVRARGPASFEIDSHGIQAVDFQGPDCP